MILKACPLLRIRKFFQVYPDLVRGALVGFGDWFQDFQPPTIETDYSLTVQNCRDLKVDNKAKYWCPYQNKFQTCACD